MSVSLFGKDSITGSNDPVSISSNNLHVAQYVWDTNTLSWIKQTGSSGAAGSDVTVTNFPATQTISGSVSVSNFPATQPVSGTVTANAGTGNYTVVQAIAANFNATVTGTVAATQSGTWTISNTSFASTQSGTWTVGLSAGTNAIGSITNTSFASTQSGTWVVNTKNALTSNSPTAVSVGITSAQVLAANSSRKGLVLTNTGSANISLGFGTAAVLNSGITLYPGGTFNMDEYSFTTVAINAIASAASTNLGIQEWQ